MGKNQSKALNTLATTLSLSGSNDNSRKKTGAVSFHTRSNSLDSISTAVSLGSSLAHSNSMDNLLQKKPSKSGPGRSKGRNLPQKKENGKLYDTLVDSASVVTTFTDILIENGYKRNLTEKCRSNEISDCAPSPAANKSMADSPSKEGAANEDGCFTDKFVPCSESEAAGNGENLKSKLLIRQLADLQNPCLHPDIAKKLSQEEWCELITYACATLGQSLLSSIVKNILEHPPNLSSDHSQENSNMDLKETSRSVPPGETLNTRRNRDQDVPSGGGMKPRNHNRLYTDAKLKNHLKKLERTTSLPPLTSKLLEVGGKSRSADNSEGDTQHPHVECSMRSRSRSHGESYFSNTRFHQAAGYDRDEIFTSGEIAEELARPRQRKDRKSNRCSCEHKNQSKKKRGGRNKSDNSNSLVDTSLDDNCPGIPENRIRRPRYHHQHHMCKRCMEECGVGERVRAVKKEKEVMSYPGGETAPLDPSIVLTLDDIQTATLLLEKSTEFVEGGSGDEERRGSDENYEQKIHPCTQTKNNHKKHRHKVHTGAEELADTQSSCNFSEERWYTLAPRDDGRDIPWPSRSGRDSPATDMAVACLDMNTTKMLQPLSGMDPPAVLNSSQYYRGGEGTVGHLYFHNHHHYHHVIHHSQP